MGIWRPISTTSFSPATSPARWYTFSYGGLADFFALDTTMNTESGPASPQYVQTRPEWKWMQQAFASSSSVENPVLPSPPLQCRPSACPAYRDIQHWLDLFGKYGVKVSFQGHEHNFQISHANEPARGIRFITSGAGGELRSGMFSARWRMRTSRSGLRRTISSSSRSRARQCA